MKATIKLPASIMTNLLNRLESTMLSVMTGAKCVGLTYNSCHSKVKISALVGRHHMIGTSI